MTCFQLKNSWLSTALVLGSLAFAPLKAESATVTYNFNVSVQTGSLTGQNLLGSFSYDDAATGTVDPSGFTTFPITSFAFTFDGNNFTSADDTTASVDILTVGGDLLGLNFSTPSFSFVSGAFTLDITDASFTYDLGGSDTGTGILSYTLQPVSSVPEPSSIIGLFTLGLGIGMTRLVKK